MSEEELIFSAIGSDNVNHFDLNVIANTLASTDRLVRQNKQQREENDKLKEKIVALRESALQIKTLYETESAKVARYDGQIESYASQLRELERQKMNAESDRLVAEDKLLKLQTNSERRIEQNTRRYHAICCDMVRLCLPQPYTTNQPPPELMSKARDLVEHFTNAEKQGLPIQDDVRESIQQLAFKNRKRKRLGRKDCHDKECQTVPTNGGMREKAINTDPYPIRPIVHHCATDVADLEPVPIVPEQKKTVCDKSTMHAMTTITRATCTSAFIKRIDFGMNFPEVTHKSVDEILRECVPLPPLLLSPIKEIVPLRNTIETQTEALGSSRQLVSCGTMTGLKNIRKRIDYRATSPTEPLEGLRTFIKKEEHADERAAHPHLATLCRLLGETIYTMMETGRRFDMQRYNMLYEQLTIIRSMLEEDGRRESMLMSAMFSNVRDPVVGRATETGYRKDSRTPFVATNPIAVNIGCVTSNDEGSSDSSGAEELCSVDATSAVLPEPAVPFATIPEAEVEATFIPTIITKETSVDDSVSLPQPEVRRVEEDAQSITTVNEEKAVAGTKQSETELVTLLSTTTTTASPVEEDAMDDDRIAQELRLMEEGDDGPAKQVDIATDCVTEEQASMPTPSSASTADQTPPRPSTPPSPRSPRSPPSPQTSRSTTSTATFVSPIKVKETNELVKDQFKTPTELPIGMRKKLRIRRSSEALSGVSHPFKRPRLESSTSSGRLSPTSTEFLLEDDWDAKFSLMRAQLAPIGVTSLCGLTPLSPIHDQSSDESEKEEEQEDEALEALETDQMIENVSLEVDVPLESSREATSESDTGTNVMIESSPEAPIVREETHETMSPASPDPLPVDDAKMPIQGKVIETLEQTIVVSPENIVEDSVVPQSPMSPLPPPPCSSDQKLQILHIETLSPASPDAEPLDVPHSPITLDVPLESPLSPPIPSTSSADTEPPLPLRIPLVHEASQLMGKQAGSKHGTTGPLFRAIEEYSNESRHEIIRRMAGELQPEAKSAKEAITAMIQRYMDSSEWTEDTVRETSKVVLERCQDATLIAQSVLDLIVSRGDIITNMNFTPPAPPLPGTQQKLVLLVRWIGRELRTLDRIILQDLNRRVFTFKSESVPLAGLLALTYMYVALEDSRPVERRRINTARLYIFKCLYYFGFKCIPLIHVVLRAFPLTLPRMGSANFDNSDTLVNTIRTVLMNMKYGDETKTKGVTAAFYRKRDLFNLLNTHYGYQRGSPTYEELLVNLMDKLRANRLRNVSYSLILVAKRNGFEWARKHIIQNRLHPLLSEYMRQFEQSCRAGGNAERAEATNSSSMAVGLDERIVACIFAVSSILKTQPSDEDVTGMMQIFTTIVQLAHRHPMIQEAAIAGLMRFSRFGQVAIYERISMWYPTHQISDRLKLMLTTMVHRKNSTFWNMLAKNRVV
ncbi:hypothetical protein AND_005585 [Anopheles darlingi]|uniref:Uncharacterized protein n=1 Tax=Anopheles darlingi TaxID=43151 RepID=W5JHB8_ANODA|nr:hypothetical protein AND_005585 [Anopheles darlingi]